MNPDITDLRIHLFDTIKRLKDPVQPMEVDRAKAIADLAREIISSAKVEVDYMRMTDGTGTGFIPSVVIEVDTKTKVKRIQLNQDD